MEIRLCTEGMSPVTLHPMASDTFKPIKASYFLPSCDDLTF